MLWLDIAASYSVTRKMIGLAYATPTLNLRVSKQHRPKIIGNEDIVVNKDAKVRHLCNHVRIKDL